ncbi:steroid 17-alpha-hydroxylase/17,20 lyase-like [Littorina saxatilis]|uniref:Cytochrome P450 n=1 Tax=Littorina saxatilis TaxID=31220 RepID=A0AAN9GQN7_9CAEN
METVSDPGYSATVAVLLGVIAVTLVYLRFKSTSSKKLAPGPRGLDALRGMVSALREGSLNRQAEQWSRQYGPLVLCRSAVGDLCVLNSPRLVREMYAGKALEHLTNNRPMTFTGWFAFFDFKDLVTSSPQYRPEWSKMRKMFHQAIKFYGDGVERMESRVQEELHRLVTELEADCGKDVDIDHVISASIMRIVLTLMTGEHPVPSLVAAAKQFDDTINEIFSPITDTLLTACPWLRHLPLLPYHKLCRDVIQARDTLMERLFTQSKASRVRGEPRGIADILLDEQGKGDNQWMTDDHVRGLLINTVGAASLTSTQTLKALFLYLTHNPEVVRRIQKDLDTKLGERTPRIQDRGDLPYVEAVVLETLRLASPVSMGLPHLTTDDVTLDGYTIPKGATVFANTLVFHRDPEIYPDPEAFKPERFLDDAGQLLPANHPLRQSMIAFGVGKRSCVGESFARSRVFLYVTTLLQHFDVLPPTQHELLPVTRSSWKNGIVLELKPYHVVFRLRAHTHRDD